MLSADLDAEPACGGQDAPWCAAVVAPGPLTVPAGRPLSEREAPVEAWWSQQGGVSGCPQRLIRDEARFSGMPQPAPPGERPQRPRTNDYTARRQLATRQRAVASRRRHRTTARPSSGWTGLLAADGDVVRSRPGTLNLGPQTRGGPMSPGRGGHDSAGSRPHRTDPPHSVTNRSPTSERGGPVRLRVYSIRGVQVPSRHALSGL